MSIKAVAFDYGGVISLPQEEGIMRELASLAGIESALMRRMYWDNRSVYDRGRVNGEEYFKNILAGIGVFPDDSVIERMVEMDLKSWSKINPETEKLMGDIKKAGLKVGVLSNMIRPFLEKVIPSLPVFKLPDGAIFSCAVDTVKPEKKIYGLLLTALDCKADELVFFDDDAVNVDAAAKLGIRAFVWNSAESARKEIEVLCAGSF
jgi:putative hydrolase of the HAD superfamily